MPPLTKATVILAAVSGMLLGAAGAALRPRLELRVERASLPADGTAQTRVMARGRGLAALAKPRFRLSDGSPGARLVLQPGPARGIAQATLRAGRQAGIATIQASAWGARATLPVEFQSLLRDSFGDGLPDSLRLDSASDRERFRRWFSFLAEMQYYYPPPEAAREVDDCAALIRYSVHEALRRHDGEWRRHFASPVEFPFEDVEKYSYPRTPLGPAIFRTAPGPLRASDLGDQTFREFADAGTLIRYNTHPVGRRGEAAQKGDLLVFYQPHQKQPYHTMIFLGASELLPDGVTDWVIYHTGESGGKAGVVKKVPRSVLREHPAARWRPIPENPDFLGFYRLNILR